ncbi:LysR family transcriptional regulator [Paenibacillus dakarensis]|uniref:LysR family transcriptional regulator n=1 Tax=Paenibacillus dakarensis TaxID=1527293 RepID=UPI0006D59968|nr:LysR family transcriptional regulator [Paenibacillus dakarensis]
MTLQQLKYIIQIVESGSMNAAAAKLYISQPSLSNAVKELEKEMGIHIFLRTNKGLLLSEEGEKFLGYARQVIEQADLLEQQYKGTTPRRRVFSVSTQHYAFAVNAFVNLIKTYDASEYEFTLRESQTYEIIEDVKQLRSELGIIYLSNFNEKVLTKLIKESGLSFHLLFKAYPHIFVSTQNPLSKLKQVTLEDLTPYPCLSYEQGTVNSFYFSEELHSTVYHPKSIVVSDRATLFNLLIGLNGYTISSGILSEDLNGGNIVSVPLISDEIMRIGYIKQSHLGLSPVSTEYLNELKQYIRSYNIAIN